jgi:hypothetical protein
MNPIWRGIGFLIVVGLAVSSFALSYYGIETIKEQKADYRFFEFSGTPVGVNYRMFETAENQIRGYLKPIPFGFGSLAVPYVMPAGFSLVIALLSYAVITVIYASFRGPTTDPLDVRSASPKRKRKVRKCR